MTGQRSDNDGTAAGAAVVVPGQPRVACSGWQGRTIDTNEGEHFSGGAGHDLANRARRQLSVDGAAALAVRLGKRRRKRLGLCKGDRRRVGFSESARGAGAFDETGDVRFDDGDGNRFRERRCHHGGRRIGLRRAASDGGRLRACARAPVRPESHWHTHPTKLAEPVETSFL